MFCIPLLRHVLIAAGLCVALVTSAALAKSGEAGFYEAYYLERQRGDVEAAAELYAHALQAGGLSPAMEAQAKARLAGCREEIACADFARLMPPQTMVYLEINNPGDQFGDLLDMLGLLATTEGEAESASVVAGKHVAISPILINELMGVRGAAAALTGFDPMHNKPIGVAVFHPGSVDAIRGMLESALPAVAEAVRPIGSYPTYHVEEQVFVCLTARLVVVSPQRPQIVAVLRRLSGKTDKSFATNADMAEVLAKRDHSAMFFCVNAKPIMPMVTGFAGVSRELALANAIVDFTSLNWVVGRAGVGADGVYADFGVGFDEGHHNLVYNLIRTPPITRETLQCVPNGAAGFLAAALGEAPTHGGASTSVVPARPPAVIGLDFGREIFANIVDFALYALPPALDGGVSTGPAPDAAAVIRVNDPAKSQVLWTQILGIASMAAGAPTTDGTVETVGGADVRTYKFPEGVVIHFATMDDKILVASTRYAMRRAVEAAAGGESILDDDAFAASLERIGEHTSKALFLHPGRCFDIGKKFMNQGDIKEAQPYVAMMSDFVASVLTDESEEMFHVSAVATGLPNVGEFAAQMIQREDHRKRTRRELRSAKRAGQWDKALASLDALSADNPDNPAHLHERFNILATGKEDREAALVCAEEFMKHAGRNANALNNLAWDVLTKDRYGGRYNELALELAEKACELTNHRKAAYVDTLALAKFETGDTAKAVELQKKAVALPGGGGSAYKKALARYEAAKKEFADVRSD